MPTYTFKNKVTGEVWTEFCSIAERDTIVENDEIEQMISSPPIVSSAGGKPDNAFRDILKSIKKRNPGSTINTF